MIGGTGAGDSGSGVEWKWKAGSLFREVEKLKRDFKEADDERRRLREETLYSKGSLFQDDREWKRRGCWSVRGAGGG